ncbi:MAG: antitoxin Xre-like helix-turn-helix domain-containing protein, partial [Bacteroidia bacterium]
MSEYPNTEVDLSLVNEPDMGYYINYTHSGMPFTVFENHANKVPFTQNEWSNVLNLSERTFQRYKKENKKFESIYT